MNLEIYNKNKGESMVYLKIKKVLCLLSMLIFVAAFCWLRTPRTMGEAMGKFVMSDKIVITDGNTGQKITLNEEERAALLQILKVTRIRGRKRYEPSCGYIKFIGFFCGNDHLALTPREDDEIEVRDAGFILDDENNQKIRELIGM